MLRTMVRCAVVLFLVLSAFTGAAQDEPPSSDEPPEPTPAQRRATVFLMQVYTGAGGSRVISCVGSGTLVSSDGLILTNAHNAQGSVLCPTESVVVALNIQDEQAPAPVYFAELMSIDWGLDLAVLRITQHLDGRIVQPGELVLPFVELGDSDALAMGDDVTVVGYPGIGQDPVSARAAVVSAFLAEARRGSGAWVKLEASIPGTMSGGGAYDSEGRLVGIPTIATASHAGSSVECRLIQDTNDDSLIDTRDACVPVGGFISAMRPARLARPLVRAAQLGLQPGGETLSLQAGSAVQASPSFDRLFFAPAVNEAGQPTTILAHAPAGTERLYLFFDYAGMAPGMVIELRTTIDGVPDPRFSLPPVYWSGGEHGIWYVGIEGQVLPEGYYECQLFIGGQPSGRAATLQVGGPAQQVAMFTDVVFGIQPEGGGTLLSSGYLLPAGIGVVDAQVVYQNVSAGLPWAAVWYYEGRELSRVEEAWTDPPGSGVRHVLVSSAEGMRAGAYRLELYLSSRLAATADFVLAGGRVGAGASVFGSVTFADAVAPSGGPAGNISASYLGGASRLYAFFEYQNMPAGVVWTQHWSIDEDLIFTLYRPWTGPPGGQDGVVSVQTISLTDHLPDGMYQVDLLLGSELLQTASVAVGTGTLSQRPARPLGVQMYGDIVDAETGVGIAGAMFIVLRAEFAVEDFVWDMDQVLASSVADAEGRFEIPVRLLGGDDVYYSVVISAEGYLPIKADGIHITEETDDPLYMRVEMNRD